MKERFWNLVDIKGPDDCWMWKGFRKSGQSEYGWIGKGGRNGGKIKANRYVLELKLRRRLRSGECSLHSCDTPGCVNPKHLFLGTRSDNMQDMWNKKRHPTEFQRGTDRWNAQVNEKQVLEIRKRYAAGEIVIALGKEFGIDRRHIGSIIRGRRWKWVGGPVQTTDMRKTRSGVYHPRKTGHVIEL